MPTTNHGMIYIGTAPGDVPIMDPDGTGAAENGTAFTGLSFNSVDMQFTTVNMHDNIGSTDFVNNDTYSGSGSGDFLTFDIGSGPVETGLDQNIGVNATITLGDGSTVSRTLSILQADTGETFIAEWTSTSQLDGLSIQSITIDSVWQISWGGASTRESISGLAVVCFCPGTLIDTPNGPRAVETFKSGDLVTTVDLGPQPVLRTIHQVVDPTKRTAPVRFAAGALGNDRPHSAMLLSPQHRVLCRSRLAKRMFGQFDVFVTAKQLVRLPGISRDEGRAEAIHYHHIELAEHGIVIANGSPVESCLRGEKVLEAYPGIVQDALSASGAVRPCRTVPTPRQQKAFVERMLKNDVPVFSKSVPNAPPLPLFALPPESLAHPIRDTSANVDGIIKT